MQSQQAALPSLDKSHERLSPKASAYCRLFKHLVGLFDSLPLHILRDQLKLNGGAEGGEPRIAN